MARCTLDLNNHYFQSELKTWAEASSVIGALEEAKKRIEAEHTSCNLVVQKFFGNKKYAHLHNKVWRYDWAPDGVTASGRKSWRMIAIVPEPDTVPLRIIAGAVYSKNSRDYLNLAELASIYNGVLSAATAGVAEAETQEELFHRVPNGDGATRSICAACFDWHFSHTDLAEITGAEDSHKQVCPAKAEPT